MDDKDPADGDSVTSNKSGKSTKSKRGNKKKGKKTGTMGSIFTASDGDASDTDGGEAFTSFTCSMADSSVSLTDPPDDAIASLVTCCSARCLPTGTVIKFKLDPPEHFDNYTCYSKDSHANVCIFANPFMLANLRDLDTPRVIEGLCGMKVTLRRVGDHPIFGTVFVDPRNKYNLVGEPVIRKLGMQFIKSEDDKHQDLVQKSTGNVVMRFHLDSADGFYKASFLSTKIRHVASGSVIKKEDSTDRRSLFTNLQIERANKVLALHEALCHPSDEALKALLESPSLINLDVTATDLKNAREIFGPCAVCLQSKPLPVTGSNPSYDRHEVPMPGEDLHMDVVYSNKTFQNPRVTF